MWQEADGHLQAMASKEPEALNSAVLKKLHLAHNHVRLFPQLVLQMKPQACQTPLMSAL